MLIVIIAAMAKGSRPACSWPICSARTDALHERLSGRWPSRASMVNKPLNSTTGHSSPSVVLIQTVDRRIRVCSQSVSGGALSCQLTLWGSTRQLGFRVRSGFEAGRQPLTQGVDAAADFDNSSCSPPCERARHPPRESNKRRGARSTKYPGCRRQ